MINKKKIANFLSNIINHGIDLSPLDHKGSLHFFIEIADFINSEGAFSAQRKGRKMVIETFFYDPILSIELEKTSIYFIPTSDSEWLDPFFLVLKFIRFNNIEKIKKQQEEKKKMKELMDEFEWL